VGAVKQLVKTEAQGKQISPPIDSLVSCSGDNVGTGKLIQYIDLFF
jgi:hypothetical protein